MTIALTGCLKNASERDISLCKCSMKVANSFIPLACASQLRDRELEPFSWDDPFSDMGTDEKSKLLLEFMNQNHSLRDSGASEIRTCFLFGL